MSRKKQKQSPKRVRRRPARHSPAVAPARQPRSPVARLPSRCQTVLSSIPAGLLDPETRTPQDRSKGSI